MYKSGHQICTERLMTRQSAALYPKQCNTGIRKNCSFEQPLEYTSFLRPIRQGSYGCRVARRPPIANRTVALDSSLFCTRNSTLVDLILDINTPIEHCLVGVSGDYYAICQSPTPLLHRDSQALYVGILSPEGLQHLVVPRERALPCPLKYLSVVRFKCSLTPATRSSIVL